MKIFKAISYAFKHFRKSFSRAYRHGEPKGVLIQCFGHVDDNVPDVIHKHMIGDDLSFVFGPIFYSFLFETSENLDDLNISLKEELEGKTDGFWFFKKPSDTFYHYYDRTMQNQFTGYQYNTNINTVGQMIKQINENRDSIKTKLRNLEKELNSTENGQKDTPENLLVERNDLLDLVGANGYDSLTPKQQRRLRQLSKENLNK